MRPLDPRLATYLAPARAPLAGVVTASTLSGLLLVGQAFAVAALVTGLLHGAVDGSWDAAVTAGAWLAAVTLGRAAATWTVDVLSARASTVVTADLRTRLLAATLTPGPRTGRERGSGELALLATRGVTAVDPYLTRYLPTLVLAAGLPALTVVAIATQDLLSAAIVVLTLPLVPVFAALVGLATRDRADRQWRLLSSLAGHFVDVMRGLPTLVAHRRAAAQSASIRAVTDRYRRATQDTLRLAFASSAVLELVATLSVALVAVTVGLRLSAGSLDLGTALVVLLLAPEAYWPLRRVGAEFHAAAEGTATFEAVEEVLAGTPAPDPAAGRPLATPRPGPGSRVEVDGLTCTYPGRTSPALDGFTATFPARGVTAVTGRSGCGKSTLLAALLGLVAPERGQVLLDGAPVELTATSWREQLAWVPQRPWLAAASVADNVRIGRPDASDDAVWAALERVALDEVVAALPAGLEEMVGEDGAGLSAGERARLALARAVVADRPLVLLDEPTAHLDALTESVILDTVRWLGTRSGVIVVAHREALVDAADRVVELPAPAPAPRPCRSGSVPTNGTRQAGAVDSATAPIGPAAPVATADSAGADTAAAPVSGEAASDAATPVPADGGGLVPGGAAAQRAAGYALGALAAASGVALTATAGWLIARAAEHPPVLMLMVAIVGVRTFGLARPVLRYAERLVSHDVALRLLAERRAGVYETLVPLVPGRLGRRRGDVLSTVVDDVDSLVDRHLRVRSPLVTFLVVAAGAVVFAAWVLPLAGAVVAATLALGGGTAYAAARHGVRRAEEDFVTSRAAVSASVLEVLQGRSDLVAWQADAWALRRVRAAGLAGSRAATRSARAVAAGRVAALVVAGAGVLAVAGVGVPALAAGLVSGPTLALLVLLPLALLEVTTPLADVGALQVRVTAADRRLAALESTAPAVSDPAAPVPLPYTAGARTLRLRRVSAGWGGSPAFTGLDLDLQPGDRVGVVGPSGSGKSTLAALLLRFLDPAEGQMTLAGVPATSLRLDDVRGCVGLVDDDPHVFASTVFENVRLARPDATSAEVEQALRRVSLGEWLDSLPQGLASMLGDGHAQVSGGERARIAMARSVLAGPPVLVLDEPTAHLDAGTAADVAADLLDVTSGSTVVWITHTGVGLDRVDRVLDLGQPSTDPVALPA